MLFWGFIIGQVDAEMWREGALSVAPKVLSIMMVGAVEANAYGFLPNVGNIAGSDNAQCEKMRHPTAAH